MISTDLINYPVLSWSALGIILMALEMLIPGVYIIWFGIAALLLSITLWLIPLAFEFQIALFALYSIGSVLVGIRVYRKGRANIDSGELNQVRGTEYIGHTLTLQEPITNGTGRIPLGDSSWGIIGENCPAGTTITIIAVTGNALRYRIESLPKEEQH